MADRISTKEGFADHFINLWPGKKSFVDDIDKVINRPPHLKGQGGLLEKRKKQLIPSIFAEK